MDLKVLAESTQSLLAAMVCHPHSEVANARPDSLVVAHFLSQPLLVGEADGQLREIHGHRVGEDAGRLLQLNCSISRLCRCGLTAPRRWKVL